MRAAILSLVFAGLFSGGIGAAAAGNGDGNYTLYMLADVTSALDWSVCTAQTCFASGELKHFRNICAVLEGRPKTRGNVETRALYVLDKPHSQSASLLLHVFKRTDTFGESGDTVTIVPRMTLDTGVRVQGLSRNRCIMTGNAGFVFAGLVDGGYEMIDKETLEMQSSGEIVSFITADDNGVVTIGTLNGEFHTYDNDGILLQNGSGPRFMSDSHNAYTVR